MSLRINQNVLALNTYSAVSQTASRLEKSIQKLSSGMRINSAADDAAGLAISEKMRRQIKGLNRAVLNAQDGISMIQTAEGALNESTSILQRMRELAIQSSNDTLTSNDRLEIQKEVNQLKDDLNRISRNTEFNTKKLLDGSQTALISSSSGVIKGLVNGDVQSSGGDYDVSLELVSGGIAEMQRSQIFSLNNGTSTIADGSTELQSIAQFYDSNGIFALATPQTLTLNGNGKTTSVQLDGQMTLDNLAAALQNALVSKSGLEIDNSRVATVNTAQTGVANLGGYIQITSGSIGNAGSLSVSSDQKVLDALGFSVGREAVENRVKISLRDSFGNARSVSTEGNVASSLLNGIDVKFDSQAAQVAGVQGLEQGIHITTGGDIVISAGTSNITIAFAAGLWSMDGLARHVNEEIAADGSLTGLSASVVEGELRLSYERPVSASSTVANTVKIISFTNDMDKLGLIVGTYSGFVDGNKDTGSLQWGMSQFNATAVVGATMDIEVDDGITTAILTLTVQTDVAVADMISFVDMQTEFDNQFNTLTIALRIDQVGSTIAFTSTRLGTQHNNNAAAFTSKVTLNFNGAAGDEAFFSDKLGMSEGTVKGSGDSNFRMHVVAGGSQFQIGAEQGQSMNINIANMSAEALGVEDIDMTTVDKAQAALARINKAIDTVSSERSKLGSFQNRLEYAINNLQNTSTNLTSAESRIRDTDMATEMIEFTRNQIVSQSGTAMLSQANMVPQGVLQLLG
ncbi:MAG TPA: flagellin [Candidatus Rifleibacterium sp.]|nr:flagellin [Candidatus Rifleibacterium sp.]HPT45441.1 flagellin [Candidatus Rifleibacterium sp.]